MAAAYPLDRDEVRVFSQRLGRSPSVAVVRVERKERGIYGK
jgi:hypothetical protein